MKLVLGVEDIAYKEVFVDDVKTTGDVAEILEGKYHVMEVFFEEKKEKIGNALADGIAAQITALVNGRAPAKDAFYGATQKIDEMFRDFLDADEISAILPLTQQIAAAQLGRNSRKKAGYNKDNEARPAFIDTGLYQQSFRSWITDADK